MVLWRVIYCKCDAIPEGLNMLNAACNAAFSVLQYKGQPRSGWMYFTLSVGVLLGWYCRMLYAVQPLWGCRIVCVMEPAVSPLVMDV